MNEYALAMFLHTLLTDQPRPVGPVHDPALLRRLTAQPSVPLQHLLTAHIDLLLANLPGGTAMRPTAVPATALWVGAALNNLALGRTRSDARLLTITLRLTEMLPAATTRAAALAYHSLLRYLVVLPHGPDWQPVAHRLLARSPLTALWLPYAGEDLSWTVALDLLQHPVLWVLVRDRLLELLPPPELLNPDHIDSDMARANQRVGQVLAALLDHGGPDWQPFVLELYEADCERQRRGPEERPTWPLLTLLRRAQRQGDALQRRNARLLLERYRPLASLLADETRFRAYSRLEGPFLSELGQLLPTRTVRMQFQRVT
jgi:hypothetical protein